MGRDDRYTATWSSVPEGHQGAYVIPPLDGPQGRPPRRPGGRRRGLGWFLVVPLIAVVAGALALVVISVVAPAGEEEGFIPASSPPPSPAGAAPESFATIDRDGLAAILADPAAHADEAFTAYAEVLSADVPERDLPAGAAAHIMTLTAAQPATAYESLGSVQAIVVDATGAALAAGEVLVVDVVVADPASTSSYYADAGLDLVRLDAVSFAEIGLYDLTQDVTPGSLRIGDGSAVADIAVRNTADEPMEFAVDLVAVGPDGAEAAWTIAWTPVIAPGETATVEAELVGDVPDGASVLVDDVSRYGQ
ncbi:hypothetical protein [Microbacterium gilvum]|uniref:Uncharacterized protein n=1 Tax=Microbacterium gilvum TaxID=1336204 RepID=A0ABP8ZZV5_9MICO